MHNTSILSNVLQLEDRGLRDKDVLLFGNIRKLKCSTQCKLIPYTRNYLESNRFQILFYDSSVILLFTFCST